jgi:UDP-2,3-diacylglucosamine hydrolase
MRKSLCFTDLHFGRSNAAHEAWVERAFIEVVEQALPAVEALYLVGDVYEIFMEYRQMIPAKVPRFIGLLCKLVDANIPVYYVVGNRDAWHKRFFAEEVGVQVIPESLSLDLYDKRFCFKHGDVLQQNFKTKIKRFIKSRLAFNGYAYALPGDTALLFAQWISKRRYEKFADVLDGNPMADERLIAYASAFLAQDSADVLVTGHSHIARLLSLSRGYYLNPGFWNGKQCYATLQAEGIQLCHYQQGILEEIHWKNGNLDVY